MNLKHLAVAVAASFSIAAAGAAQARVLPDGGVTAAEMAAALQAKGYKAEVGRDGGGDPMISSALDGSAFKVLFYRCETGRCTSIQFSAGFDLDKGLSLAKINLWNRENRFGRGWLDDEMDPYVDLDVDLEHGATTESLTNLVERWEVLMPAFKKFIDF